jgi:hypothetical protein
MTHDVLPPRISHPTLSKLIVNIDVFGKQRMQQFSGHTEGCQFSWAFGFGMLIEFIFVFFERFGNLLLSLDEV